MNHDATRPCRGCNEPTPALRLNGRDECDACAAERDRAARRRVAEHPPVVGLGRGAVVRITAGGRAYLVEVSQAIDWGGALGWNVAGRHVAGSAGRVGDPSVWKQGEDGGRLEVVTPAPRFCEFGRRPDAVKALMWGCRAIFNGRDVELVPNRGEMIAPDAQRAAFAGIVDAALMRVRAEAAGVWVGSREVIRFEFCGVTVEASPQGSHGYLYVGVWADALPAEAPAPFSVSTPDGRTLALKARKLDGAKREVTKLGVTGPAVVRVLGLPAVRRKGRAWVAV